MEDRPDWAKEYEYDALMEMFRERLSEQTENTTAAITGLEPAELPARATADIIRRASG